MQGSKQVISRVTTPRGEIQLQKVEKHYEIILNGVFIMATYNGLSEKQMFSTAFNYLDEPQNLKVLIGGLGVGFTLEAAVRKRKVSKVDVVEIEPVIIEWNEKYFSKLNRKAVFNKKVNVINDDFKAYINKTGEDYDIICVDVDNGPDWVVLESNKDLYKASTLTRLHEILKKGGVLSIWSAEKSSSLFNSMKKVFGNIFVKEVAQSVPGGREITSYIYISKKTKA